MFLALPLAAQITVVISPQGTDPITRTTGYKPKNASLARLNVCNAGDGLDITADAITGAVIFQEGYGIYGSDAVNAVLSALQNKDLFTRAQKAIAAASNTAVLLTALFKMWTPLTAAIIDAAPAIAAAILPAAGDPRDLAALGKQLLQDNSLIALSKPGSQNCRTVLVVAMTPTVRIDKISVQ